MDGIAGQQHIACLFQMNEQRLVTSGVAGRQATSWSVVQEHNRNDRRNRNAEKPKQNRHGVSLFFIVLLALMAGVRNGFLPQVLDRKSGAQLRTQSSARHLQAIGEFMQVAGSLSNNGHLECRAEVGK
jgi:hypothetical protein